MEHGEQARIRWNRVAYQFDMLRIPRWGEDPFLRQLESLPVWDKGCRVLDLGCGAGRYSIAVAPRCASVVGSDISDTMIACAKQKKEDAQAENARFFQEDWATVDLEERGYENHFDLVLAHMTPAVHDLQTLERMNRCSKGYCALATFVQRQNPLQGELFSLLGLPERAKTASVIPSFFSYFYEKGMYPQVAYYLRDDTRRMPVEEAAAFFRDRVFLQQADLTPEQEEKIDGFIREKQEDGIVVDTVTSVIVVMIWNTQQEGTV